MADTKELNLNEMEQIAGGDEKPKEWVRYTVVDGDILRNIAARYMVTVKEIKEWNNLHSDTLVPGMVLLMYSINY